MKVFLFSHIADCDGITPIILSKLAFEQVDYELVERDIDTAFLTFINEKRDEEYDQVFITDLCISKDVVDQIPERVKLKLHIFDHHISSITMTEYPFIQVVVKDEKNSLQSGTSLYYNYLCQEYNNEVLSKPVTKEFVELVRLLDTWEWKEQNKIEAKWLGSILSIIGIDEYINYYYHYILNQNSFSFEEKFRYLLEIEDKKIQEYILLKEKQLIPCNIQNHPVGIVFAEQYRSLVGNALAEKYSHQYDFIVIINVSRSISYRAVKNEINVNDIASCYGGHGHKLAAGSPLPEKLKENIISMIFSDAVIEEEE